MVAVDDARAGGAAAEEAADAMPPAGASDAGGTEETGEADEGLGAGRAHATANTATCTMARVATGLQRRMGWPG
jgi:hypothetical protein